MGYRAGPRHGCSVARVRVKSLSLKAAPPERSREALLRCSTRAVWESLGRSSFWLSSQQFLSDLEQPATQPEGDKHALGLDVLCPSVCQYLLNYVSLLDPNPFLTAQDLRKMFSLVEILL